MEHNDPLRFIQVHPTTRKVAEGGKVMERVQLGETLLDKYAGQAMTAILQGLHPSYWCLYIQINGADIAQAAFLMAEEMMQERARRLQPSPPAPAPVPEPSTPKISEWPYGPDTAAP